MIPSVVYTGGYYSGSDFCIYSGRHEHDYIHLTTRIGLDSIESVNFCVKIEEASIHTLEEIKELYPEYFISL